MLSLKYIRENTDFVQESLIRKQSKFNIVNLLELDNQRRQYLQEVEQLRAEKNKVSNIISELKRTGKNAKEDILAMRTVSERIKEVETELRKVEDSIDEEIYFVPNIVHSSVPTGKDETANIVVREWGEQPDFSFTPKDHLELGERVKII